MEHVHYQVELPISYDNCSSTNVNEFFFKYIRDIDPKCLPKNVYILIEFVKIEDYHFEIIYSLVFDTYIFIRQNYICTEEQILVEI
jgi:hypothetical protein